MATINTTDPKPGYVYDTATDTWYPLLGLATQSLDGLTDVTITTPTTGQILAYDGTVWINQTETGDISAVTSGTGISVTNSTGPIPSVAIDTAVVATTNNTLTMTGKTLSQAVFIAPEERWNVISSAATGTVNLDVNTAGVLYYTSNSTGNWTLNVRGDGSTTLDSILTTGDSITVVFFATQGSSAFYQTGFTIDGSSVTPKWQNGVVPSSGNANSVDIYSFTIIKTGSATFTAFGSQTKFS